MRLPLTLSLLLLTASACVGTSSSHERLMDEIEAAVVLPERARPLASYDRNYAFSGPDRVVAAYLARSPRLNPDAGCQTVLENFSSRPCTSKEIAEMSEPIPGAAAAPADAGKRRWYESIDHLPSISGRGCAQVSVEYDVRGHRVLSAACNGNS